MLLVFNNTPGGFGAGYPTSITMDVSGGFAQVLSFYDIAIERIGSAMIYSGLDGTGALLANVALPITPEAFSSPTVVTFAGIAESVVFTGGNDQLALDNISFGSVPEPSAWISLCVGLGGSSLIFARRRRKPTV